MLSQILQGLVSPVTSLIDGWQTRKNIDAETKAKIATSKVENQIRLDTAKIDAAIAKELREDSAVASYDQQAMKNMQSSWKDEYLILLHTLPIWGYAVPSETLHKGLDGIWVKLGTAPDFWWVIYIGMVASTFGLRWLFSKQRVDQMISSPKTFKDK